VTKRTATSITNYNGLQIGSALLMVSLGAACSSSSVADSADSGDSGAASDDVASGDDLGDTTDAASAGGDSSNQGVDGATGHVGHPVVLGMAGDFAILAKSAVSTVPKSAVTGNVGVSPAAATFITGFSLAADATNVFSKCPQVTGKVYAANYAVPTPANLTTAIGDMQRAFTDAAGRAPDVTELGAGNIGGKTLMPGVYRWGTGLLVPTNVTLAGSATDVWIFQIAQNLTLNSATKVLLSGGAVPANVFWEVAGAVDVGTTAHLVGTVLSKTAITLQTGASIDGRLLAQTAVSIDSSVVAKP